MFGFGKSRPAGQDMAPREVEMRLSAGDVTLVDVREPAEFAAERIRGAINLPLSRFDPARLPEGKPVVLHCLSGGRSRRALDLCAGSGVEVLGHMAGGIGAWKGAGLPTMR